MKGRTITALLGFTAVYCCACAFTACSCSNGSDDKSDGGQNTVAESLEYELNEDKKSYICTGIGTVTGGDIEIKSSVTDENGNKKPVTAIGEMAFCNCGEVTGIAVPDTVTSIGNGAFYGTAWYENQPDGLIYAGKVVYKYKGFAAKDTSIMLKDGTKGIADEAFSYCIGLTNITIPDSVTNIGERAFYNCSGLKNISVPDSVNSIGDYAFYNCGELTSVDIPDTITSIGNGAFGGCGKLTEIVIPESVISVGESAFKGCDRLANITIPDSVAYIGKDAFRDTVWYDNQPDGLVYAGKVAYKYKASTPHAASIVIEDGTKSITDHAFERCSGLDNIIIPDSVISIGDRAFSCCNRLKSISIPDSVITIGGFAFYNCDKLEEVVVGKSVTTIGKGAFLGCGLTGITIPDCVTSIGEEAFYDCSGLTSVKIGKSVESIGLYAFAYCGELTNIDYNGAKEKWLAIEKGEYWSLETGNYTVHCTDGVLSKDEVDIQPSPDARRLRLV